MAMTPVPPPQPSCDVAAPASATQAILAARRAAAAALGAPLDVRLTAHHHGHAQAVAAFATRAIEEGELLFCERPLAAVPMPCGGDGAGLRSCAHCLGLVGGLRTQLCSVGAAAGLSEPQLQVLLLAAGCWLQPAALRSQLLAPTHPQRHAHAHLSL
jgi:hypothetical protein